MNTVAHSAGTVCCPDLDSAMRHRDHGSWVSWFNTGAPHPTRPWFNHVGQMISCPAGSRTRSMAERGLRVP